MLKWILLICLSWHCMTVCGQRTEVVRSSETVVIKGKSFYLHTVEPHQSLASISRAYGISIAELKQMNGMKDDMLRPYDVLKIPYVRPFVQQDGRYYYHRVKAGETLYSVSVRYGLKLRRILKYNREYMDKDLKAGDILRLPLKEIDLKAIQPAPGPEEGKASGKEEKTARPEESAPERKKTTATANPLFPGEVPAVRETQSHPAAERPFSPYTKVAVLLPFSANDYPVYSDSLLQAEEITVSPRTEQFLDFYKGILLAVDSLKQDGHKIELHTFDTERKTEKAARIAAELDRLHPDLIIGPVYGSTYKTVAEGLSDPAIPMIYPLSSRSEGLGRHPGFIQLNPSFEAVTEAMEVWLCAQKDSTNVLHIRLARENGHHQARKQLFKEHLAAAGIPSFHWNMENSPLDSIRICLQPDRENILVLPLDKEGDVIKVLPLLCALTEEFPITVIGLPEWQTFNSVDHETFYKLNTKIFTYSYVDYAAPLSKRLTEKSHVYFRSEPGPLLFKAFDLGYHFIRLASSCRGRLQEALCSGAVTSSSRFHLKPVKDGMGMENHGFFIVNFRSDYQLEITCPADNSLCFH